MGWARYTLNFITTCELGTLRWAIFNKPESVRYGIRMVIAHLYPFSILSMRKLVCPFCGKRFRTKQALTVHILRTRKCYSHYSQLIEDALIVFKELQEQAIRNSKNKKTTSYLRELAKLVAKIPPNEKLF